MADSIPFEGRGFSPDSEIEDPCADQFSRCLLVFVCLRLGVPPPFEVELMPDVMPLSEVLLSCSRAVICASPFRLR